jgi:hypothetical protein
MEESFRMAADTSVLPVKTPIPQPIKQLSIKKSKEPVVIPILKGYQGYVTAVCH